jgi:hypothetical protein
LITAAGSPVKALRRLMPALLTRIETGPTCSSDEPLATFDAVVALGHVEQRNWKPCRPSGEFLPPRPRPHPR